MAIKFSSKDQPSAPAAAKPAKSVVAPKAAESTETATDLFKSPDAPKGKAGKKK